MPTIVRIAVRVGLVVAALIAVIAEHNFLYALRHGPKFVLIHHAYRPNTYDLVFNLIQTLVVIGLVSIAASVLRGMRGWGRKVGIAGVIVLSGAAYWISKVIASNMVYPRLGRESTLLDLAYWVRIFQVTMDNHQVLSLALIGALVATLGLVFGRHLTVDTTPRGAQPEGASLMARLGDHIKRWRRHGEPPALLESNQA